MQVLVIGKSGQLANELLATCPDNTSLTLLGRSDIDILDESALNDLIKTLAPDVIINASAYTAVDKAESEEDAAYQLNEVAVANLACFSKKYHCRFLHVSTDFVFDGESNRSYRVEDTPNPTGVYGASKLAGEQAISENYPDNSAIVRTSWVYSSFGNNFVKTMLRLMNEKDQLGVVCDQIGCPTYAKDLAEFLWCLAKADSIDSIYHWSDAGVASWYDFAVAIQVIGLELGLISKPIPINGIPSSAYPTPAKRPTFSLLNTSGSSGIKTPKYWREQLALCMNAL